MLPLVIIWLAAHAFVLALILGVKFVGAKIMLMLALIGAVAWLVVKRPVRRLRLPDAG